MNFLRPTLNRPLSLPHVDEDGDAEMEIDEQGIEKGRCVPATKYTNNNILRIQNYFQQPKLPEKLKVFKACSLVSILTMCLD